MKNNLLWLCLLISACTQNIEPLQFETNQTTKPWTYWWWLGSAVTHKDISEQLTDFHQAGMGGVHIIPIYGVKGEEEQFLRYLSPEWKAAVKHTILTADSLGMGVDLTLGTGWPFGGAQVSEEFAAKKAELVSYRFPNTELISFKTDSILNQHKHKNVVAGILLNAEGETKEIANISDQANFEIKVDQNDWTLLLLASSLTGQKVKRAAPGGEGLVMDYFDSLSVIDYLQHHDSALADLINEAPPRSFYHDSYEVYGANWTTNFLKKFESLQGYPLQEVLPIVNDSSHAEHGRVLHDIRATLAELLYANFTSLWTNWSNEQGSLTRNQAHGSPGNILDLYAQATIPETESFGTSKFNIPGLRIDEDFEEERFGKPSPLMMKFASSAAHLSAKSLVSSETTTWLGNHFKVSLSQVKPQIDELFVSGINHIFYHGMPYSPKRAEFPGWLFYASTNFNQNSHFWDELPELNRYISECQSYLQNTKPDHDILLYFPIHDLWTSKKGKWLLQLDVHHYEDWFSASAVGELTGELWHKGYTFDYLSDLQLQQLSLVGEQLQTANGTTYQTLLLPPLEYIPLESLEKLHQLATDGAKLIFMKNLPQSVAAYHQWEENEEKLKKVNQNIEAIANMQLLQTVDELQTISGLSRESMKDQGLDFIRKKHAHGHLYFISNLSSQFNEGPIRLAVPAQAVEMIKPLSNKRGLVDHTAVNNSTQVYLQLKPGESCLIITYDKAVNTQNYLYTAVNEAISLPSDWKVEFIKGNTDLLSTTSFTVDSLTSWTNWPDTSLQYYSGKARYILDFDLMEKDSAEAYLLSFSELRESAQVILNGKEVGTVWALPYEIILEDSLMQSKNRLELIVQNLSANRMRYLDSQGAEWKKFYDINMVDITYQSFDATRWKPEPSGIVGPVSLKKLQYFH